MTWPSASRCDARTAIAFIAAAIAFAATAFAPQVLNDGDTFLHIAAGRKMLADHAILFSDPFSFTFAGAPWDAHEWLAEILMASAYQTGGWSLLLGLFAGAAALTAGLLAFQLGRRLDAQTQAVTTLLALACMTGSLLARPHLLALPLLALWTIGLVRARSDRRPPSLALLPLMTIWVNIHASFLLGLALAAGLALEALVDEPQQRLATLRGWGLFGAGALGAALINPHFVGGITFPLSLMSVPALGNVGEWQAADFSHLQPFELVIAAALYVVWTRGVRIPPVRAVILLVLLHLALQHQRHQIVVAVIAPLLLADPLSQAFGKPSAARSSRATIALAAAAVAAIVVLGAARIAIPLTRGDGAVSPVTALNDVPAELRTKPVLNDYSFGGFLIFSGVRPFIDSRAELYGQAALARYAALIKPDPATLDTVIKRYGIRWSILSPSSPMVAELDAAPHWKRIHTDRFAIVHIRDSAAR